MKTRICYETHKNCNGSVCNHDMATRHPDSVLLIPDPEPGAKPDYGIAPGCYSPRKMLDLIHRNRYKPDAIQYIADMLETGVEKWDGFARTLRLAKNSPRAITAIVSACRKDL